MVKKAQTENSVPQKKTKRMPVKSATVANTAEKRKDTQKSKKTAIIQPAAEKKGDALLSPLVLWSVWLDGWKKTFTLRGRSSRFELWIFLLLNSVLTTIIQLKCSYILSPRFLLNANNRGYSLDTIDSYITAAEIGFYLVILLPLFPIGSMLIRRMHDLNRLAWTNYLEPVFMGGVVLSGINLALSALSNTDYAYTAMLLSACFIALLYGTGFYALKFLIMTLFYRGDAEKNNYGPAGYNDAKHEEEALNISCIYFLFIMTVGLLYLALAII